MSGCTQFTNRANVISSSCRRSNQEKDYRNTDLHADINKRDLALRSRSPTHNSLTGRAYYSPEKPRSYTRYRDSTDQYRDDGCRNGRHSNDRHACDGRANNRYEKDRYEKERCEKDRHEKDRHSKDVRKLAKVSRYDAVRPSQQRDILCHRYKPNSNDEGGRRKSSQELGNLRDLSCDRKVNSQSELLESEHNSRYLLQILDQCEQDNVHRSFRRVASSMGKELDRGVTYPGQQPNSYDSTQDDSTQDRHTPKRNNTERDHNSSSCTCSSAPYSCESHSKEGPTSCIRVMHAKKWSFHDVVESIRRRSRRYPRGIEYEGDSEDTMIVQLRSLEQGSTLLPGGLSLSRGSKGGVVPFEFVRFPNIHEKNIKVKESYERDSFASVLALCNTNQKSYASMDSVPQQDMSASELAEHSPVRFDTKILEEVDAFARDMTASNNGNGEGHLDNKTEDCMRYQAHSPLRETMSPMYSVLKTSPLLLPIELGDTSSECRSAPSSLHVAKIVKHLVDEQKKILGKRERKV